MPATDLPPGTLPWTVRKGSFPRQPSLPPAAAHWSALFPEFEIGPPVTRGGGDQILYQAQIKAGRAPCLLLFIGPEAFSSPEHRAGFLAGMAVVQQVTHPNLLALLWTGEREGHVCLGYEAFSGDSLYNVMDHFLLEPPIIAGITGALGQALEAFHQRGIWHRDLTPGWILLNRAGIPKLAGTGISLGLQLTDRDHHKVLMRRPEYCRAYLAPEQVSPDGSSSDHLTDIFALGAITYELLVGNPPSGFAMAPSSRAQVGTFVDQVVFRALHSNREVRYASAAGFGADIQSIYSAHNNKYLLDRTAAGNQRQKKNRRQKKRGWIGVLAGSLLLIGGLGAAAWHYLKPPPPPSGETADHRAEDARNDRNLQNLAGSLSKKSGAMTKGQKENLMAVTAALLRNVMDAAPGSRKTDSGMVAAELLMQAGEEDLSLESLLKLQAEAPPDSVDWRRIEALTQLMRGSRAGQQASAAAADRSRRAGDPRGERHELARAAGFLPGWIDLAARRRANLYNPLPALQATLSRMRGSLTGGPVKYSIRSRGLELHVDLSGNPRFLNLAPLAAFPITHLDLSATAVSDLSPLARLPLHVLRLDHTRVTDLTPVTTGSIRLLTAENCAVTNPGSLDQCLVLQHYRITLRSGLLLTKISDAHWGRPWVNSLGYSLQPIATRSRLLAATTETLERDYLLFTRQQNPAGDAANQRPATRSRLLPWQQSHEAPATAIRWADAQRFCSWLTLRERAAGQIPVRARYRLLTLSEWNQAVGHYRKNESRHSPLAGAGPAWQLAGNRPPAWNDENAGLPISRFNPSNWNLRHLSGLSGLGNTYQEWSQDAAPDPAGTTPGRHLITDLPFPTLTWNPDPLLPSHVNGSTSNAGDDSPPEKSGFRLLLELPPVHALDGEE